MRLACGHDVPMTPGVRLWCYYDTTFGVLLDVKPYSLGWYDFEVDGSPYCGRGNRVSYDSQRLACQPCGVADVARRRNDPLVALDTFELVRPYLAVTP